MHYEKIDLKRYLVDDDDDGESSLVEISRYDFKKYQLLKCLYVGNVDTILQGLSEEKLNEIQECDDGNFVYIYLSERLRIGMKRHGKRLNPKCEVILDGTLREPEWYNVGLPFSDAEIMEKFNNYVGGVTNEEILVEAFKEAMKDEKKLFQKCSDIARDLLSQPIAERINFRPIKFEDYFNSKVARVYEDGTISYEGWTKVTGVPSLGWARFIQRISYEGDRRLPSNPEIRYNKCIVKKGDKWDVRLNSFMILDGDEKILRFVHYYGDKIGLNINRAMMRQIWNYTSQGLNSWWWRNSMMASVTLMREMYEVFAYIEKNGESSDEEIAEWLETATKW